MLKPIDKTEVRKALDKFYRLRNNRPPAASDYEPIIQALKRQESYKSHFLIPVKGDKMFQLSAGSSECFFIQDCLVVARRTDQRDGLFPQPLW